MLVLVGIFCVAFGLERVRTTRARAPAPWRHWLVLVVSGIALVIFGAPRGLLLSKSVGLLVMPLGLLWSALLVLASVALVTHKWREAAVLLALWLGLTLAGNEPLSHVLMSSLEGGHAYARALRAGRFDAVIVLGGGTDTQPGGEIQLGESGDRVLLAARLYHAGATPLLVTSGSPIEGFTRHDSTLATERIWRQIGVPQHAIVRAPGARTTSEEARVHAALVRERGLTRVGLVTSARHMPRALGLFEALGIEVVPLPADVRSEAPLWHGFHSVIPNGPSAERIHAASWELVGRIAGR